MTADTWIIIGSVGQFLSAIFMLVGFIFVIWQINSSNNVSRADFILRMESEFNDHHSSTYHKFLPNGIWYFEKKGPTKSEEISEVERYLGYFANLQILRIERLINLETIDKMFAFRFFISMNNPHTQKIIKLREEYWEYLLELYNDWTKYRKEKLMAIPNDNLPINI